MSVATLVLARNTREAHKAASLLGLPRKSYRVVNSATAIRAVHRARLYLVEGWDRRPERFVMKAQMRLHRRLEVICFDPAAEVSPEPKVEIVEHESMPDTAALMGDFNAFFEALDEAFENSEVDSVGDFFDIKETDEGQAAEAQQGEDAAPHEEPARRRRRSRCKQCGALHFKEDSCPEDEATPLSVKPIGFEAPDTSILSIIGGE